MTIFELLLISLATWNVSSLLVQEDGPFLMFARLRNKFGVMISAEGITYAENGLGEIFLCLWCMSRWVAIFFIVLYWFFPIFTLGLCAILSVSTMAILIDRWT